MRWGGYSRLAVRVFGLPGLGAILRKVLVRSGRFALEFHGVGGKEFRELPKPLRPYLNRRDLWKILEWCSKRFPFLTPEEFLRGSQSGVLLTFDDGLANNFEVALPVLEEFSAPAILFVTTSHISEDGARLGFINQAAAVAGYDLESASKEVLMGALSGMTPTMLKACAGHPLITIGSHTISHPCLSRISDAQLTRELQDSKSWLEKFCCRKVRFLAYPFGDYDERVIRATVEAGYQAAFVETTRGLGGRQFEIPRVGVYASMSSYLEAKTSGLFGKPVQEEFPLW